MSDVYSKDIRRRQRDERRRQLLENPNPACACCGEDRVVTLELHHIAGEANSDAVTWLCKNCHAIVSDMQYDGPPQLLQHNAYRDPLTRAAALLRGLHHLQTQLEPNSLEMTAALLAVSNALRQKFGDDWVGLIIEKKKR